MPHPRLSPKRRHTLCASLRNRNALQHFTRASSYKNLREKCRASDWAQNVDAHFARACAVKMHFSISQEPLCTEIYRKNAAPQTRGPHFVRTCAVEMHFNISGKNKDGKRPQTRVCTLIKYRFYFYSNLSVRTHCLRKNCQINFAPNTNTEQKVG